MTPEELLGPVPRTGGGFRHVEHGGLAVVESVPGVFLDVHLDVGAARRRLFHAGHLITRNIGVAATEVELKRDVDLVQHIQAARHIRAVERDGGVQVALCREEVGDGPAEAEPDDTDAAVDLRQRAQPPERGRRVGNTLLSIEMGSQFQ